MNKKNITWTIKELSENFNKIEFPDFQREPTVWNLKKKLKLIDSILRNFDIASIYLYKRNDEIYECIDGRQRINAILSFLGLNDSKIMIDNNFIFRSSDELLGSKKLGSFDNKKWKELEDSQRSRILEYKFNVLEISDVDEDEELNLMFLRLQLGTPLNAGEKLNAMVGDMKEFIFGARTNSNSLGDHGYFDFLKIPNRRYAKQLTAAQIALNFFSIELNNEYRRARFIDLQNFFREYNSFNTELQAKADLLKLRLDSALKYLEKTKGLELKNRAIGISTFFFINDLIKKEDEKNIKEFLNFLKVFLTKLIEQIKKGIDIDPEYRNLLKFQNYISQAAVEKSAIENRQEILKDYFEYYKIHKEIKKN